MIFIVSCLIVTIPHAKRRQPPSRRSRCDFSSFRFHYEKTKSSGDFRPGGEALFVSISVHSWFKINVFQIFNVMLTVPMGGSLN